MILDAKGITKIFSVEEGIFKKEKARVTALDGVSFSLEEFQTLGIVGESGSGKTTLAKIILKLVLPTSGKLDFSGRFISDFRKDVQIIFQNPYNSLDPKMRIKDAIIEPLIIHRITEKKYVFDKALELVKLVGLDEGVLNRYPFEFSGGQRQRICIARAIASQPKLLVLDEPISSLDLTIQARLLDLFVSLKDKFKLTYIFISHNLAVIKHIADRVLVIHHGKIVEEGDIQEIFSRPQDPYTKALLASAR